MGIAVRLSIAIGRDDGDANEYANTGDDGVVVEEAAAVFCFGSVGVAIRKEIVNVKYYYYYDKIDKESFRHEGNREILFVLKEVLHKIKVNSNQTKRENWFIC